MHLTLFLLTALAAQPAPQGTSTESRFHRVHLRNGNFVDGHLQSQSSAEVTLRMATGTITINRDLIDRVEYVKMRGVLEAPTTVDRPSGPSAPPPTERREPFTRPHPVPAATAKAAPSPYAPEPPLKIRVDALVDRLALAAPEEVDAILRDIVAVEGDTTSYVAALMETKPAGVAEALGPFLKLKPERTSIPYVLRLLSHPSGAIRAQAATGLGACGDAGLIPVLGGMSRDPDATARAAAVTALSEQEEAAAFDALAAFVADADREVRTRALGSMGTSAVKFDRSAKLVETLKAALERGEAAAKQDVLSAMGRSGELSLSASIVPYLKDTTPALRAAAAAALGDLAEPSTAGLVLSQLQSETDEATRSALAAAATRLMAKEAIPVLIGWLGEEKEEIQRAALRALKELSGQDFQKDQGKWEAWWDANKP